MGGEALLPLPCNLPHGFVAELARDARDRLRGEQAAARQETCHSRLLGLLAAHSHEPTAPLAQSSSQSSLLAPLYVEPPKTSIRSLPSPSRHNAAAWSVRGAGISSPHTSPAEEATHLHASISRHHTSRSRARPSQPPYL